MALARAAVRCLPQRCLQRVALRLRLVSSKPSSGGGGGGGGGAGGDKPKGYTPSTFGKWITPEEREGKIFGAFAAQYDQWRPSYPDTLFSFLKDETAATFPNQPLWAADLGCGTGIASAKLLQQGFSLEACDPDEGMLDIADRKLSQIEHAGTSVNFRQCPAEVTGLDDDSVHLVTCFQAWHWVEQKQGLKEVHRIVKPKGLFLAAWNDRDLDSPFVQDLETLIEEFNPKYNRHDRQCVTFGKKLDRGGLFSYEAVHHIPHKQHLGTADNLVELTMTFSYVRNPLSSDALAEFSRRCRDLALKHYKEGEVAVPLITHAYLMRRVAQTSQPSKTKSK